MEDMLVIKRDGRQVCFDKERIVNAILSAFKEVEGTISSYAKKKANNIADFIYVTAKSIDEPMTIEVIQDLVENGLANLKNKDVAKAYILYREERNRFRGNITDDTMLDYLEGDNEYWATENSNKDANVVTTQRDYIAGIASTDIARRKLLSKEVCEAHDAGIIHQHDMDYMLQMALHNCDLININDCLQNGTVINKVKIDPQNRLLTATTVATQIITAVASSQYGGCTITTSHLAPFVRKSYNIYLNKYLDRGLSQNEAEKYANEDLMEEISSAVQTFNYQINSMSTTNGQAPFLSVFFWIDEDKEYEEENAMLIREFLKQRIKGMKNEKGIYITPAFPKLLYVLDENNIKEGSKYWDITKLAAECSAKRLVPDYISAKKMRELKGDVYGPMGK